MNFRDSKILITGGTGSLGQRLVRYLLEHHNPKKVIIFSRDEFKQYEMQNKFKHPALRFFLGDIRDKDRLDRAFYDIDCVIHAAALKQVPSAEYNPFEAVKTNVIGSENIINAAIDQKVKRVVAISTDKACNPVNLYGATKLCSEKLFISGNSYAGGKTTRFSVVRYGNVVGSKGSVVPYFYSIFDKGVFPITHKDMTRFWITFNQACEFILHKLDLMHGGEIFIPKIPSMKVVDLAKAMNENAKIEYVGIRPGEKLHEIMVSQEDSSHTLDMGNYYIIEPQFPWWTKVPVNGKRVADQFSYTSDNNSEWVTIPQLRALLDELKSNP